MDKARKDYEFFKRIFVSFLKQRQIYTKYIHNIHKYSYEYLSNKIDEYPSIKDPNYNSFLCSAFLWHYTPEGYNYWNDIDRQWRQIYQKIERNVNKNSQRYVNTE